MTIDFDWTNITNFIWDGIVFVVSFWIFESWAFAGWVVIVQRVALEGEAMTRLILWRDGNGGNFAELLVGVMYWTIGIWLNKLI